MKKQHHSSLKLHTIYTLLLIAVFGVLLLFVRDMTLGVAMLFLALYISGNGIIHARKNVLHRDTLLEYLLVGIITLVLLIGFILQ